jgi:hypothetical protein
MLDGRLILLCPFFIVFILSIILAYIIECIREYFLQQQKRRYQIEYLSIVVLSFNETNLPSSYKTLFFSKV